MARLLILATTLIPLPGRALAPHAPQSATPQQSAKTSQSSNHLSLASRYLENGDRAKAIPYFRKYLAQYPRQWDVRTFFAEVLLKENRLAEAKSEFRRFLADAQVDRLAMPMQFLHGHQRLYDIARREEDSYRIHLHRGLAMFWLAQARRQLGDVKGDFSVEGILVKAARELVKAHRLQPMQAKACWYLTLAWRQLGQTQLAQKWLRRAHEHAPFSNVTPFERWQIASARCDADFGRGMFGR